MTEGHDELCYYCNQPCNTYAGNPGLWPLGFTHEDEPGVVKWHHTGCVQGRLHELERVRAEVAETWDVVGGPPEHPEEDPEVSTLPAAVRVTVEYEREQRALAREHLKAVEKDRDDYKLAADTWQADALRDGAALEKVRQLLGTSVFAEKVPEVLENMLKVLSRPCSGDRAQSSLTFEEIVKLQERGEATMATESSCPYRIGSLTNRCFRKAGHEGSHSFLPNEARALDAAGSPCPHVNSDAGQCRRRAGHSGPHTSSPDEACRLDAVVTHEDLKKLKDELIEALDEVCAAHPKWPAGFRELAQILRGKRS